MDPKTTLRLEGLVFFSVATAAYFGLGGPLWLFVALVWIAHIGIDRAVGYGLKYPTGFKQTHLSGADDHRTPTSDAPRAASDHIATGSDR